MGTSAVNTSNSWFYDVHSTLEVPEMEKLDPGFLFINWLYNEANHTINDSIMCNKPMSS